MQIIYEFFVMTWNKITDFLGDFMLFALNHLLIWVFDLMIYFSTFAYNTFSSLLTGLEFDTYLIEQANNLHPTFGYIFGALHIAAYLQIIITAYVTVFVLKLTVPFYG